MEQSTGTLWQYFLHWISFLLLCEYCVFLSIFLPKKNNIQPQLSVYVRRQKDEKMLRQLIGRYSHQPSPTSSVEETPDL